MRPLTLEDVLFDQPTEGHRELLERLLPAGARLTYTQRCAALKAEAYKKPPYDAWGTGAFMPPVFAEPRTPAERMALTLVQSRFPNAVTITVEMVVELVSDALAFRT